MQVSPEAEILKEIGHSQSIVLPSGSGQVVLEDTRLRNWQLAFDGGLDYANPVVAKMNAQGEMVRVRTLDGSPYGFSGALDIQYAVPGDVITWSGNTIVRNALAGGGVDLWADESDADEMDVFWVDDNALNIRTAHSSDGGHTWGLPTTIHSLGDQGEGVLAQLCAPALNTILFSNSRVGVTEDNEFLTGIMISLKVSGTWTTAQVWDLGGHILGIEERIELPNGDFYTSNLSGVQLSPGRIEIAFFANSFRESAEDGIWVERVANLNYAAAPQNLHWAHPFPVYLSIGLDDDNERSTMYEAFPRLQIIGEEYWITCLEVSRFGPNRRYHLAFHRSLDGVHWTDRDYHQGAANNDETEAYCYNGDVPFLIEDLIYANLVVFGNRVFIVGFDKVFYCPATSLVGVDNPQRKVDLTNALLSWDMNLPTAPTAGSVNYEVDGIVKEWNLQDLIAAHYGIKVTHQGGYYDTTEEEDVFIQIGQFNVDTVSQHGEEGQKTTQIQVIDDTLLMDRWKADTYWQWESASEMVYNRFCDTTSFIITQGGFTTGFAGRLRSSVVRKEDNFFDDIAVFNLDSLDGGICVTKFQCDKTWEDNHMGIAFQGRGQGDGEDNKIFWAVLYNRNSYENKFTLQQAIPRTSPNKTKLYRYRPAVAESSTIVLDDNTPYWLRVGVWHSHVMVWYTDEPGDVFDPNWILVLDFLSEDFPPNQVIPCRYEWWGLIGTQRTLPSGALGILRSDGGMQDLFTGTDPRMVALHVQLGDEASILRRINVSITQENIDSEPMPDALVMLLEGDANNPFDATDPDNVIYTGSPSALFFGAHDSPQWLGANPPSNPEPVKLAADQHVWIAVSFDGELTAGQSYKWASSLAGGGPTKYSDNEGASWNGFANPDLELTASIEVEYLNGRVKFFNIHFGSGETTYTFEDLAHHIASKAGVMDIRPDDFVNTDDLILGPDNIWWQPEVFGKIDDFILEADVALDDRIEILLVQDQVDGGNANGFMVRLDQSNQRVTYFFEGDVIDRAESLAYIPQEFHLRLIKRHTLCYVYVNEALASICYHPGFAQEGYVGVFSGDYLETVWTNLRIPDLRNMVARWDIPAGTSALQSLQQMCAKPTPGTTARARFFIDYLGRLRIGSFQRREVVDTYENTIKTEDKSETIQGMVTQNTPVGNYYGTKWDGELMDQEGRRHEMNDITDGRHDRAAIRAAEEIFRNIKEKQTQTTIKHAPVWPAEREDLNRVIDPILKTNENMIIDNMAIHYAIKADGIDMSEEITHRSFAGEVIDA